MKPVSGKEMCKILQDHGWSYRRTKGSHHIFGMPGRRSIPVPVHGNNDLRPGTQRSIMNQADLTDSDL